MRDNQRVTRPFERQYEKPFPSRKKQPFSIKVQTVDGSIEWVPQKTNSTDACFNIKARSFSAIYSEDSEESTSYVLEPGGMVLAKVGFILDLLPGWEAQIRTKMSLILHTGLSVLDSTGTIDSSYRDEVQVILINNSEQDIELKRGDEVAQIVIAKVPHVKLWHVQEID